MSRFFLQVANPFLGLSPTTYPATADVNLHLVDAGLGGENIPFFPFIQPERKIDVIIAIDASADTNNYPDGQEIYHTYQKSLLPGYGSQFAPFPVIPTRDEFLALGLNSRPVFFGSSCSTNPSVITPLIVCKLDFFFWIQILFSQSVASFTDHLLQLISLDLPNYNINFATNTSTFTPTYSAQDQVSFFDNSFAIVTQSGSIPWTKCLACTLVDAQVIRNGGVRSAECSSCFTQYCHVGAN